MKKRHLLFVLTLEAILLVGNGCSSREWIKKTDTDQIAFTFFIFAKINGKKYNGNGDAVLERNRLFQFRMYDNILAKYVLSFVSSIDGTNEIVLPLDRMLIKKVDPILSKILAGYLYYFFVSVKQAMLLDANLSKIELDNDRIRSLSVSYGSQNFKIEILMRYMNGQPKRIRIDNGENWMVFDVVEYCDADFEVITEGYQVYWNHSSKTFLEWIGEVYGGG